MKQKTITILLLALALFMGVNQTAATAQGQAQVTIIGIPQILPSPYISDFEQNIFAGTYQVHLNLTGAGSSAIQVRFHVRVTLESEVLVDETSLPATFDPGFHVLSPFSEFVEFEATTHQILEQLPGNRFRQAFQTGSFPEGNYTITIEPQIVGSPMPGIAGRANFTVQYPQPPTLVSPANGAVLSETVSTPVFTWAPVMGPPGMMTEYEFLLVELFDGQNAADALVSNREHASAVSVGNTMLPYTGGYLPLEEGKTYAWQVTARDVNDEIPINNEGRSEIHVFTYGSEEEESEDQQDIPAFTVAPGPEPQFPTAIPVTTISGEVQWKFRATEGSENVRPVHANNYEEMQATNNNKVAAALDDPNYDLGSDEFNGTVFSDQSPFESGSGNIPLNSPSIENSSGGFAPVFGGGSSGGVQIGNVEMREDLQQQLNDLSEQMEMRPLNGARVYAVYYSEDGKRTVITSTETNEDGSFTLSFAPSELANLIGNAEPESSETSTENSENSQQFGFNNSGISNLQNIQNTNIDLSVAEIKVEVHHQYFFTEDKSVLVRTNSPQAYNAGTFNGEAKTYRLNSAVMDTENGNPIPGASVEIFRPSDWYETVPALVEEGLPLPTEQRGNEEMINGVLHTKVAEAGSEDLITRLFPRIRGQNDRYTVRVNAPGYEPMITHLSTRVRIPEDEIVTIDKTYELLEELPVVEGRIVRSDTQEPLANVPVAVKAPDSDGQGFSISSYIAQTDNEGRFIVSDIALRDAPYTLAVSGSKVNDYEEDILLNERGVRIERDPLMLDPTLISIAGRILNDKSVPVTNASVRWADGGTPVQTDTRGRFVTANTAGTHQLQVRKIGHQNVDTTLTITIDDDDFSMDELNIPDWSAGSSVNAGDVVGNWFENVNYTESFQADAQQISKFSPGSIGYSGNSTNDLNLDSGEIQSIINDKDLDITNSEFDALASYFNHLHGDDGGTSSDIQDVGTIIMNRSVGKLDVTLLADGSGEPIEDALVEVGNSGLNGKTDDEGNIYFDEAPGGTVPIKVKAPESTFFVPLATEVTVTDNGDITYLSLQMEAGARATGMVTAAGEPVDEATVRVEGREDIYTLTDANGNYTLPGIPVGEWTLRVSKSGLVGASEATDFEENEEETVNFDLQASDFNIATLLGFEIEVDELSTASDTTISGAFVSLASNELLSVADGLRIPFSDINVYEDGGVLKPVGGEVQSDVSEIDARLFDFLHVTIKNDDGLVVQARQIPSTIGYVAGTVEVDYASTFTSATGWEWPNAADQYLVLPNAADLPEGVGEEELVTITSDGSFPFPDIGVPDFELIFGSASETLELFGFDVTLTMNESVLRNDGFHLQGDVSLANIPLLDEATVSLDKFWIGTDGTVREASLDLEPSPELTLADWKMELISGTLSETGFALGGNVEVHIPGSDPTDISFSDLSISPEQLFGGQFTLPSSGVDVFGIVDLQTKPGTDISFGKVQNEDVYYVTGAATVSLPKYVEDDLEFRNFLIQTNGQFNASIAANFETDFFGLADLTVTGVEFRNTGTPSIYVDSQFGLRAIPFVSAQAGGLTYQAGGSVSFDEIDLGFDLASIGEVGAGIGLIDTATRQGFSGSGNMNISGTPIDAGIEFSYERVGGGIELGADIQAGIPPVPVGNFSLENLGGGFSVNQSANEFSVSLRGTVAVAPGTGQAIAIDPLEVTVESGPVITGNAALTVMSESIADASLTIDFPNSLFDVEANIQFQQLEKINITADASTRLVVSGDPQNSYWMVGASMNAELLNLFDANANILAAWNLNYRRNSEYSDYTRFITRDPEGFFNVSGSITGLYLGVDVEFGRPESNPKEFGIGIGKIYGYMYNKSQCKLEVDFTGNNYGMYIGSSWEVGGGLNVFGFDAISIHGSASGTVEGGYNNTIWYAEGEATGTLRGYIGNCNIGCGNKICTNKYYVPVGASGCVGAGVKVDYASNTGLDVTFSRN